MSNDAQRLRRLGELGIEVWQRRQRAPAAADEGNETQELAPNPSPSVAPVDAPPPSARQPAPPSASASPRIRLAPGRGRWLLLGEGTDRPDVRALLDDLRGLLGPGDCRFGQWSDSAESGVAAEDWPERGIDWVLDFGGPGAADARVIGLPSLLELVQSPDARKQLWQTLRPLVARG